MYTNTYMVEHLGHLWTQNLSAAFEHPKELPQKIAFNDVLQEAFILMRTFQNGNELGQNWEHPNTVLWHDLINSSYSPAHTQNDVNEWQYQLEASPNMSPFLVITKWVSEIFEGTLKCKDFSFLLVCLDSEFHFLSQGEGLIAFNPGQQRLKCAAAAASYWYFITRRTLAFTHLALQPSTPFSLKAAETGKRPRKKSKGESVSLLSPLLISFASSANHHH